MNLKFWEWDLWTYRRQLQQWRANSTAVNAAREASSVFQRQRDEERNERKKAQHELEQRLAELADIKLRCSMFDVRCSLEKQPLLPKPELLEALKAVQDNTPWWRAVHSLLNDQERTDLAHICAGVPMDEMAHFRRGRLAAIEDLRDALAQHRVSAQKVETGQD